MILALSCIQYPVSKNGNIRYENKKLRHTKITRSKSSRNHRICCRIRKEGEYEEKKIIGMGNGSSYDAFFYGRLRRRERKW